MTNAGLVEEHVFVLCCRAGNVRLCLEIAVPSFAPGRSSQGVGTEMCHQPELGRVSGKLLPPLPLSEVSHQPRPLFGFWVFPGHDRYQSAQY